MNHRVAKAGQHDRIKIWWRGMLWASLVFLLPGPVLAAEDDDRFKLRQVRTEYMRLIYYDQNHYFVVPHLTRCFENSLNFHRNMFGYTPNEYVSVILQDSDDHGYAGTTTMPYNYLTLGIEPFEHVYETCPTNERINWVMSHELLHVVAADQASGTDSFFRDVFLGKPTPSSDYPESIFYSYLTNPRRYAPRWFHEGLAVFMETWMAGGIGRAQNGYDEMVFRTMVRDSSFFYDIVGIESEGTAEDFQTGQLSYLYGTRFVSYLAYKYGPETVIEWASRSKGSKRSFSRQFKHVYGIGIDDGWREWIAWERDWQRTALDDSIRQYPVTPTRRLTRGALGSVSRAYFDPAARTLYAAVRYPNEFAHIGALNIDTGEYRKICEISSPALYYVTSLAYDDSTGTLFFTDNNARGWRNLRSVDIATGKTRTLMDPARIGDLAFCPADRALWGIQHHDGLTRLVRMPPPYEYYQELLTLSFREDLYDLDVSPDGKYLTGALVGVTGQARLIKIEVEKLLTGEASYEVLHEFPKTGAANFVFTPDGRHLYGSSYYTGTSNIWRYDLQAEKMEAVSNCETGFFRPVPVSADSLIVFEFTGDGFVPVMIADATLEDISAVRYLGAAIWKEHPIVREWGIGSPLKVDPDSVITYEGNYNAFRSMRLTSAYPILEAYKAWTSVGARFNFMDPVGLHSLDFSLSYTGQRNVPDDERLHFRFNYGHYPWNLWGAYNRGDFYDFFGPTKMSRKGFQLGVTYRGQFHEQGSKSTQYALSLARYWGLEVLPEYQNVPTSYDNFLTLGGNLRYMNLKGTIGGVEAEKGIMFSLNAASTYVRDDYFPRFWAELTYGLKTFIPHSSLWLRTTFGQGIGPRDEPFANFFFGAFGNNWVDHAGVNRYRQFYSYPGLEINEVGGRNFVKAGLEWPLPPIRFKRMGLPNLYFNWMRLALFGNGLLLNADSPEWRQEVYSVGAQLNLKLVLFFALEQTLSFGYGRAFEENVEPRDEWMVSLKILR